MGWEVERRFKREGTHVYLWLIHVDIWQKPTQHCKAIILQLKIKKIKNAEVWNMALECVTMCDFRSSEDLVRFWESH